MIDSDLSDELGWEFARWGEHADGSPLYRHLAIEVSQDDELLDLAAELEHGPKPNVLFAAVQFLLQPDDGLARWYPSSRRDAVAPDEQTHAAFRSFVLDRRHEILEIGRTRFVQTNEPRRAAALLPYVAAEADRLGEPVHVIEVGASAGLNLCMDKYSYAYGSGTRIGHSALVLSCEDRGAIPVPERVPFLQRRVGIDLHPVNVDDPSEVAWLDALVWPEQAERRRRLAAAIAIRRSEQIAIVAGDASVVLTGVARRLPTGGPVVIWHSFTLNQFSDERRQALDRAVLDIARQRSVSRIGWEFWDRGYEWPEIRIGLTEETMRTVARAHHHGEWVEAVAPEAPQPR